jgi:hypothetical protein
MTSLRRSQSRTRVLAFENRQLLTQSKIFDQQGLARAKEPMEEARPKAQEVEHGEIHTRMPV